MNVLGTSLAGASKKKRSTNARAQTFKVFVASSLHACLHACPVLYYAVAGLRFWALAPKVHLIRACLSASLLQFLPSPPVRAAACCVHANRRAGKEEEEADGVLVLSVLFL